MSFLRALQTPLIPSILLSALLASHSSRPIFLDSPPPPPLFPPTLTSPTGTPLTLIAQGIRTVSLFRIKVYDVGLYADLRPPLPFAPSAEPRTAGERMQDLLESREVLLRIVPSRKTSFTHMRDGFLRALTHRLTLLPSPPTPALQASLAQVASLFPNSPLPASTVLTLSYHPPARAPSVGSMSSVGPQGEDAWVGLEYEGRVLGEVRDGWVAREWVMSYFDEKREISKELRERTEKKLNELVLQSTGKAT